MSEHSLPKEYKGFSTTELLALWKSLPDRTLMAPRYRGIKFWPCAIYFMNTTFLTSAKTTMTRKKIRRHKKLLAPYGIDLAPWADENGIEQPELGACVLETSTAGRESQTPTQCGPLRE